MYLPCWELHCVVGVNEQAGDHFCYVFLVCKEGVLAVNYRHHWSCLPLTDCGSDCRQFFVSLLGKGSRQDWKLSAELHLGPPSVNLLHQKHSSNLTLRLQGSCTHCQQCLWESQGPGSCLVPSKYRQQLRHGLSHCADVLSVIYYLLDSLP